MYCRRNGEFTVEYAKGDRFVGEYRDGRRNGQGTYIFENREKYVGEFKDGKMNGQGTYTFSDDDKYIIELAGYRKRQLMENTQYEKIPRLARGSLRSQHI